MPSVEAISYMESYEGVMLDRTLRSATESLVVDSTRLIEPKDQPATQLYGMKADFTGYDLDKLWSQIDSQAGLRCEPEINGLFTSQYGRNKEMIKIRDNMVGFFADNRLVVPVRDLTDGQKIKFLTLQRNGTIELRDDIIVPDESLRIGGEI
jgi:hypothetical protein